MTKQNDGVARLPVPTRLEPKASAHTLMMNVRNYYYSLWNSASDTFRELCASVGNKDSITGNRLFDRHEAVGMIKEAATDSKDGVTVKAKDGDIYRCLVSLLRQNGMGLQVRRQDYRRITRQAPAE